MGLECVAERRFCRPQLVVLLQVHPDLWAGAEPLTEPERRLRRDAPLALQNLGHAVDRHANGAG